MAVWLNSLRWVDKAMPLYLYRCHTCELELEELHPMGQAPE